MAEEEDIIKTCDECGAAVYPDHIEHGRAGKIDGKLLCPICYREHSKKGQAPEADEPIALIDEGEMPAAEEEAEAKPRITAFGEDSVFGQMIMYDESKFARPLNTSGRGAVRCRTFHTKLTDAAISYMDSMINQWTDKNPQIEIKYASSTIGMFEGKQRQEPHLILTIFY
jgi:hypothetical protein